MTALTRGPLPARVYWRRRLVLLLLVLGLVVAVVRLTGLGADPSPEQPRTAEKAAPVAADTAPRARQVTSPEIPSESRRPAADQRGKKKRDRGPVLAEPEGVCSDRDVAVTPSVRKPVAGGPVTFTLELRTVSSPACTWHVSPSTLTMKLTSGKDDIWTSQDCPRAVPSQDVVVRSNVGTEVEVTWSGRRSDDECSRLTDWALPGWYYVDAAALAGEPSDLHFELLEPDPEVVTKTVRPEPEAKEKPKKKQRGEEPERSRD